LIDDDYDNLQVRNQLNNNSAESLTRINGKRKKEAPQPPIYRPLGGKDAGNKRKAPSPPIRIGGVEYEDLYEKVGPSSLLFSYFPD